MEQMKYCHGDDCKTEHPLSNFYTRPDGKPYKICKKCHAKKTALHPIKEQQSPLHETRCIEWLKSCGIPAMHGKGMNGDSSFFVDVIAFGCVNIEVKLIQKDGRVHFTHRQIETPYSDIIVIERYGKDYHVFMANNPTFYKDGKVRVRVPANEIDFATSLNSVNLIELELMRKRIEMVASAKVKAQTQLKLFDAA